MAGLLHRIKTILGLTSLQQLKESHHREERPAASYYLGPMAPVVWHATFRGTKCQCLGIWHNTLAKSYKWKWSWFRQTVYRLWPTGGVWPFCWRCWSLRTGARSRGFSRLLSRDGGETTLTSYPKSVLQVVDAHMHLDQFVKDTGHTIGSIDELKLWECCPTPTGELLFYVVNNAFLDRQLSFWTLSPEDITDKKARLAYSVHPKTAGLVSEAKMRSLIPRLRPASTKIGSTCGSWLRL